MSFDFSRAWRRLIRLVNRHEKVLLAILAVVILISGGFWYRQFAHRDSSQPTVGGTYVEGIVFDKEKKELNQITLRLTKAGLLGFSRDGNLESVLTEKWSANADQTEFHFTLLPEIARDEIITELSSRVDLIGTASVSADGERDVTISLPESSPSLPLALTRPMFDYGPYKLGKTNDQTTVFSRNTRKGAVAAYLNKIIIHTYPNIDEVRDALTRNRIDGAILPTSESIKKFDHYQIDLNRYYAVLFNTNKSPFRETGLRQSLINGTPASATPFTLIAPDQEPYRSSAQELVEQWRLLGASVELDLRPQEEVTNSIGPTRSFQALLVGIDYGAELDPYYIWHSSQVRATGNNVTGFKNSDIDGLITQIRGTLDIKSRQVLIKQLHDNLTSLGVAEILETEQLQYYLSSKISFVTPALPRSATDRFLSAAFWSVK